MRSLPAGSGILPHGPKLADAKPNTDINAGAGSGADLPELDTSFEQGLSFLLAGIAQQ